jgi:hypothetical protein
VASCSRAFSGLTTKPSSIGLELLALRVGVEQAQGLLHDPSFPGDETKAPRRQIARCVVEAVHMERLAIDDHHLAVITDELGARSSDGDARLEHPELQIPQSLLASRVGMRDERADGDAAPDGGLEGLFERLQIEPKDDDVDGLLRLLDGVEKRLDTVMRAER